MPGAWTTKTIKDSAGADVTMRVWDESGAGTGPFSFGQVLTLGDGSTSPGETHLGEVSGKTTVFDVTLSLDTSAYASGDLLADTQIMDGFFRKTDGTGVVQSIQIIDEDDVGAAFDIYFLTSNVTMGTENSVPTISDANSRSVLGPISVVTGDYKDLGGVKVASVRGISLPVKAVSGTDDLYVAVVNGTGTPTYTASGVRLRVGGFLD